MNSINLVIRCAIASIIVCLSAMVSAQDLELNVPNAVVLDYDPFSGSSAAASVRVLISNPNGAPQDARLVISPSFETEFSLRDAQSSLRFDLISPLGNSNPSTFSVPIPIEGKETVLNLTVEIPASQYAEAGTLRQELSVELIAGGASQALASSQALNISTRVPMRAQINFAGATAGFGSGSSFTQIDFGMAKSSATRGLNFQIRGNSDVDIMLWSENLGRLRGEGSSEGLSIPYTTQVDGATSDLSTPLSISRRPDRSLDGTIYPIQFTLGAIDPLVPAGRYRDLITIEVNPR